MAIAEIGRPIRLYTGLSADVKPTNNVPYGSRFFETDTGDQYIYGIAGWGVLTLPGGGGGITALTGVVTAGPGVGSQATSFNAATVASLGLADTSLQPGDAATVAQGVKADEARPFTFFMS